MDFKHGESPDLTLSGGAVVVDPDAPVASGAGVGEDVDEIVKTPSKELVNGENIGETERDGAFDEELDEELDEAEQVSPYAQEAAEEDEHVTENAGGWFVGKKRRRGLQQWAAPPPASAAALFTSGRGLLDADEFKWLREQMNGADFEKAVRCYSLADDTDKNIYRAANFHTECDPYAGGDNMLVVIMKLKSGRKIVGQTAVGFGHTEYGLDSHARLYEVTNRTTFSIRVPKLAVFAYHGKGPVFGDKRAADFGVDVHTFEGDVTCRPGNVYSPPEESFHSPKFEVVQGPHSVASVSGSSRYLWVRNTNNYVYRCRQPCVVPELSLKADLSAHAGQCRALQIGATFVYCMGTNGYIYHKPADSDDQKWEIVKEYR